eukprot:TRINITY_DN47944_c0_g1_i1.p1 TRINITY_DN47944_c0_g1~~TRINITY_DN47944_c0_g1_i1.p1  ORF type:complete len:594 (-),score=131.35 TRINITY_DN47944_c0_g1_i1:138-1919(-)
MKAQGQHAVLLLALLSQLVVLAEKSACKLDDEGCEPDVSEILQRLSDMHNVMDLKASRLQALAEVRSALLSGERKELPQNHRNYLASESPLLRQVTHEVRHRPVSTNTTRFLSPTASVASESRVRFQAFVPLKRSQKGSLDTLVATVSSTSRLAIHAPDGEELVGDFDLGHGKDRHVTQVVLSPGFEKRFILTADDDGLMRAHTIQVVKKALPGNASQSVISVGVNFSTGFPFATGGCAERKITAVVAHDSGEKVHVLVGDSLGDISAITRKGSQKGRIRVTNDPGGVRGLVRWGKSDALLFYGSRSLGLFSVAKLDLLGPSCRQWHSPIFHVVVDRDCVACDGEGYRIVVALLDGDVLVVSPKCEVLWKFPKVSPLPLRLQVFHGYTVGLPLPRSVSGMLPESATSADDYRDHEHVRELLFFNMEAMEQGFAERHSRAVSVQVSFGKRVPEDFALVRAPLLHRNDARSRARLALRFEGESGLQLYSVNLKMLKAGQAVEARGQQTWPSFLLQWGMLFALTAAVTVWLYNWLRRRCRRGDADEGKEDGAADQPKDGEEESDDGDDGRVGKTRRSRRAEEVDDDGVVIEELDDD